MSPTEFEIISTKLDNGFHGVHARIDTFKDEFNSHRLTCKDLFANIMAEESSRKGAEKEKASALRDRVSWGTVKTYIVGLLLGVITLGALKILFTNLGQWKW